MTRKQMARPDDSFYVADDLTRLSRRELVRIVVGGFVLAAVFFAVAFAAGVSA